MGLGMGLGSVFRVRVRVLGRSCHQCQRQPHCTNVPVGPPYLDTHLVRVKAGVRVRVREGVRVRDGDTVRVRFGFGSGSGLGSGLWAGVTRAVWLISKGQV